LWWAVPLAAIPDSSTVQPVASPYNYAIPAHRFYGTAIISRESQLPHCVQSFEQSHRRLQAPGGRAVCPGLMHCSLVVLCCGANMYCPNSAVECLQGIQGYTRHSALLQAEGADTNLITVGPSPTFVQLSNNCGQNKRPV
jgi:hypothetical protein